VISRGLGHQRNIICSTYFYLYTCSSHKRTQDITFIYLDTSSIGNNDNNKYDGNNNDNNNDNNNYNNKNDENNKNENKNNNENDMKLFNDINCVYVCFSFSDAHVNLPSPSLNTHSPSCGSDNSLRT
jgi:hypothetical protein